MEILLLGLLATITIVPLALFIIHKNKSSGESETNLPPGSFGRPIVGETLEFLYGKPEKFVGERMKRHSASVFKTKILGEKVAVLCGPAGNKFIFSNEQKHVTEWRPHSMQKLMRSYEAKAPPTSDPTESKTKVLRQPGFLKPEALSRFMEQMDSTTRDHLKLHWEGQKEVTIVG